MVDVTNHEQLKKWLHTQRRDVSMIIAARASLRVFPVFYREFGIVWAPNAKISSKIVLPVIRAMALPLVFDKYSLNDKALRVAANFASAAAASAAGIATNTVLAADAASSAAICLAANSRLVSATHASDAVIAAAASSYDPADSSATASDTTFIKHGSTAVLALLPLWPFGLPEWVSSYWGQLKVTLNSLDEDWDVWTRWYDAVLEGKSTPGGQELDIFRVLLNSEEDWSKGPSHVNQLIKTKEEEIASGAQHDSLNQFLPNFKKQEEVEKWLSSKSDKFSISLASRSAFRILPFVRLGFTSLPSESQSDWAPRVFRDAFRALAHSRAISMNVKDVSAIRGLGNAAQMAEDAAKPIAKDARTIVFSIAYAAFAADHNNVPHTASVAITGVFDFDPTLRTEDFELALVDDIKSLTSEGEQTSPITPFPNSIWHSRQPAFVRDLWQEVRSWMLSRNEDWDVWTRWYDAVLEGKPTPGGEELDVFRVTLNSEEDWEKSPASVNALIQAREVEIVARANLSASTSIAVTGDLATSMPEVPAELNGQAWGVDRQTGLLVPVFRQSNQTESEVADMEGQRPFLLECARGLVVAIETSTSNSARQLLPAAERYRRSIELSSSLISIPEVYAAGVRLRNSHDRIRREVENEGMPDIAINIGEAMDSVIGLHGPFILATARGREMNARARDDSRTKIQELAYKAKSLELSESLRQSNGLVTETGKNLIAEINGEIATGPHPERSTMLAEASNHNFLVTTSGLAAKEYTKTVLLGTVAVQSAVGNGISVANIALNWMLANTALLLSLAATSPETLYWLPHFLNWLKVKHDLSKN